MEIWGEKDKLQKRDSWPEKIKIKDATPSPLQM